MLGAVCLSPPKRLHPLYPGVLCSCMELQPSPCKALHRWGAQDGRSAAAPPRNPPSPRQHLWEPPTVGFLSWGVGSRWQRGAVLRGLNLPAAKASPGGCAAGALRLDGSRRWLPPSFLLTSAVISPAAFFFFFFSTTVELSSVTRAETGQPQQLPMRGRGAAGAVPPSLPQPLAGSRTPGTQRGPQKGGCWHLPSMQPYRG